MLSMAVASPTCACMLAAGTPTAETALPKNDTPIQRPIVCDADRDDKNVESADCLQRVQGLVAREGEVLRLNLDNGKTKVYTSNANACTEGPANCLVFQLAAYYPSVPSFLVMASSYECGHYELISRRSGSVVKFSASAVPDLSPNGKYLVSVDQSDACDRGYELAIWSTTDPPVAELEYKAKQYENWTVTGWPGDGRIKLKVFANGRDGPYDQDAQAVRSEKGWKLVMGKKVVQEVKPNPGPAWPTDVAPRPLR